jgi:hypothetical protein
MPLLIVFAFALPFLLWPLEAITSMTPPYASAFEELAKFALLVFAYKQIPKKLIKYAVIVGSAFFLTETIFYLFNIYGVGILNPLIMRFTLTLPMHILTSILIAFGITQGKFKRLVGLFFATTIHLLFNLLIKRLGI